jgi:hypothetical protein
MVIIMNRLPSLLLTTLAVWSGWAQVPLAVTVENLVRAVRSELQARQSDEQIARAIEAIHIRESLDDEVIEQLPAEGAGRLAADALERQRDVSYRLPPPAASLRLFEAPAAPSAEEQARVLEQARAWAMQYTASLPNFLCAREAPRYTKHKNPAPWQKADTLTWEVGYADRKDYQKLVAINGRPTQRKGVHGAESIGEFGGIMSVIFRPEPETKFQWLRWSNLRGRPTHVFSYYVDQKHAGFGLASSSMIVSHRTATAIRGSVYIDGETHHLMRFICDADGIPSGFPILGLHTVVDYGYIEIGGEKFLLPIRSNLRLVEKNQIARNVTEFANYRKFTSEVKIDFGNQ